MANGYEPGEYFAQFLSQLPAMYRAKEGVAMQKRYITLAEKKYADALEQQKVANQLAQQKHNYTVSKYEKDVFDKERDEEQDIYDDIYQANPDLALKWYSKEGKYNPGLKDFATQSNAIQTNVGELISTTMMSPQSWGDKKYNLETIKNTRGISAESVKNVEHAIKLAENRENKELKSNWLYQNRDRIDPAEWERISLLTPSDAKAEILEKDPSRDLARLLSLSTASSKLIADDILNELPEQTLKLHKTVIQSTEKQINKIINPVAISKNNAVYNQAVNQIMQNFPQYFEKDKEGKLKPRTKFEKIAIDSVNNLYNKLIKNQ